MRSELRHRFVTAAPDSDARADGNTGEYTDSVTHRNTGAYAATDLDPILPMVGVVVLG